MNICDTILIVCLTALTILLVILLAVMPLMETYKKKKHSVWFTHFNRATHNAFSIGKRFSARRDRINERINKCQQAYMDHQCNTTEFKNRMSLLADEYVAAVMHYYHDYLDLGIEEDLKAADAYAKEHNCKWGIIYSDKES